MKRITILSLALAAVFSAAAQDARIYRTEFVPFATRDAAKALDRTQNEEFVVFSPKAFMQEGEAVVYGQVVELSALWSDRDAYLHIENAGAAYDLLVNDTRVASVEDPVTPREFEISRWMHAGQNAVMLELRPSRTPQLQQGVEPPARPRFENSYLALQHRPHIEDVRLALLPDSTRKFGVLELEIVVTNYYNDEESMGVGYDIYDPKGKLLDYGVRDCAIPGRGRDTVRFSRFIYHTYENKWADGRAPLYKVTFYTKRNGMLWEYIPLETGFGRTEFRDGRFYRFDKELALRRARCNAAATEAETLKRIKELKAQGVNTLCPDYPQPHWFYRLCDRQGMWVVDRANVNAPGKRADRRVGGTPSNDPALEAEYLDRVKAMYYRSRNHTCILAYALGGDSGNGYNMYRAYEWLKSVECERPVFYGDAAGEWNTDPADEK